MTHPIVLATLNSKYIHASFGLRYLKANLGDLESECALKEFTIQERPVDIVEQILAERPKIVGFGVYIWNATQTEAVIRILKLVAPEILIVIGGPEVSYEWEEQSIVEAADVLIKGEGELLFREVCEDYLQRGEVSATVFSAPVMDVDQLKSPYRLYSDEDLANRVLYVEASRGCPFKCEYCLSSLDKSVRAFDLEEFLAEMDQLLARGATQFKFVDRTFNLKIDTSQRILSFFLERWKPGIFVHFEMVPDRLPDQLREVIAQFPEGVLQFEVGIQTFNPEVSKLISRRQNLDRLEDNLNWLRSTGVHVHADLIAGLPGESLESFGKGFERLVALGPQEVQVGILKRLRGTPISRHTEDFGMVYDSVIPYEILKTSELSFADLQDIKRFARYWDLVGNSGNFPNTLPLLLGEKPFENFWAFAAWLWETTGQTHKIALKRLFEFLWDYLSERHSDVDEVGLSLLRDWRGGGRRDMLNPLRPWDEQVELVEKTRTELPERQSRHVREESRNSA